LRKDRKSLKQSAQALAADVLIRYDFIPSMRFCHADIALN
jgi:hypothetical protein